MVDILCIVFLIVYSVAGSLIYFVFYKKRKEEMGFAGKEAIKIFALFGLFPLWVCCILVVILGGVKDVTTILILILALPTSFTLVSFSAYFWRKYVFRKSWKWLVLQGLRLYRF